MFSMGSANITYVILHSLAVPNILYISEVWRFKIDFTNNFVLRNESDEALDNGSSDKDLSENGPRQLSSELNREHLKNPSDSEEKSEEFHQVSSATMSFLIEPPAFISSSKKFAEYKKDLLRWSRLTSVKPELQAEMVIYRLEGHPTNIKKK